MSWIRVGRGVFCIVVSRRGEANQSKVSKVKESLNDWMSVQAWAFFKLNEENEEADVQLGLKAEEVKEVAKFATFPGREKFWFSCYYSAGWRHQNRCSETANGAATSHGRSWSTWWVEHDAGNWKSLELCVMLWVGGKLNSSDCRCRRSIIAERLDGAKVDPSMNGQWMKRTARVPIFSC